MFTKKTGRIQKTADQVLEFSTIIFRLVMAIAKRMDRETIQYWIGHEKELTKGLRQLLLKDSKDSVVVDEQVVEWIKFYQTMFSLELDPADFSLPATRPGFGWVILVAKGLTRNAVFELCQKRFPSWRYFDNLDEVVTINDREPTESYAIRIRDRIEADEENKNLSANQAMTAGIKGVTNLERMLLELWYYWKNEQHLDQKTVTICSGSRYSDGYVPRANWLDDLFKVSYVYPDDSDDYWRVREVVS